MELQESRFVDSMQHRESCAIDPNYDGTIAPSAASTGAAATSTPQCGLRTIDRPINRAEEPEQRAVVGLGRIGAAVVRKPQLPRYGWFAGVNRVSFCPVRFVEQVEPVQSDIGVRTEKDQTAGVG